MNQKTTNVNKTNTPTVTTFRNNRSNYVPK